MTQTRMIRLLAGLVALLGLGAVGLAGQQAWNTWQDPLPQGALVALTVTTPRPVTGAEPQPPPRWAPLFGATAKVPPQPPAPKAEPQPPAPPAPPVASLGYTLKGTVSSGETRWALVSHPTGDTLLRVGEALTPDYTVVAIDAAGMWVQAGADGPRHLLEVVK